MSKQIYITLPVKDLNASVEFFTKLGYSFNDQFGDESAKCMIVSDTIYFMLGTHEKFADLSPKAICDTSVALEALFTLSCDSREAVDDTVAKAVAAGGATVEEPTDYGFMYMHSFVDLDGHAWNMMWMDPNGMPPQ